MGSRQQRSSSTNSRNNEPAINELFNTIQAIVNRYPFSPGSYTTPIPSISSLHHLQSDLTNLLTTTDTCITRSNARGQAIKTKHKHVVAELASTHTSKGAGKRAISGSPTKDGKPPPSKQIKLEQQTESAQVSPFKPHKGKAVPLNRQTQQDEQDEDEEQELNKTQEKQEPQENEEHKDIGLKQRIKSGQEREPETFEGDTRAKNPKSEYVETQEMPPTAFMIMDDEGHEEIVVPAQGSDDLKRVYGVASYPTKDLRPLLAGPIPDENFSKPRPTNQVQFSTFWSSVENYFRSFTEEDLSLLNDPGDNLTPYIIPPLGPFYLNVWAEEDGSESMIEPPNTNLAKGNSEALADDRLETQDISCGPLATRLLSALLTDTVEVNGDANNAPSAITNTSANGVTDSATKSSSDFSEQQQGWRISSVKADYYTLEERLKREFRFMGILDEQSLLNGPTAQHPQKSSGNGAITNITDDSAYWRTQVEDDEICAEMRRLQTELKSLSETNFKRKQAMEKVVRKHMAYQEYTGILEDLDKQIDQAYIKRLRTAKTKRKKGGGAVATAVAEAAAAATAAASLVSGIDPRTAGLGEGTRSLLDKRRRWIDKIGPLFPPPEVMKRVPDRNLFDFSSDKTDSKNGVNHDNKRSPKSSAEEAK